ncbi:MAG: hypothetical protein ACKO8G_04890 [Actinomycetota bacterium]
MGDAGTTRRARPGVALACAAVVVASAAAGTLVVSGERAGAGPVVLAAGFLLVAAASATGRPGRPRERVLVSLADRALDGCVLGALVWSARRADPGLAAAALLCFALGALAAYARARACGLGYDLGWLSPISAVKTGGIGLALLLGWGTGGYLAIAAWLAVATIVRVSQVWKEELA